LSTPEPRASTGGLTQRRCTTAVGFAKKRIEHVNKTANVYSFGKIEKVEHRRKVAKIPARFFARKAME
jgi:hypothetical protein